MINVGKTIKQLRLKNQMTQDEVASRTDLSAAYISQLETGKTSINIETLNTIVIVLGSTLSDFFSVDEEDLVVYKKNDVYKVTSKEYCIDWLISDASKRSMEPIIIEIQKDSSSETVDVFDGEAFGHILHGSCILIYGNDSFSLEEGDSFYVKGVKEHKLLCGSKAAKVLWVTNPPYF